jgi:NAD(P)-dependent dehydrogenase (short-subunit alcohol dehydrogenase family)
MDSAMFWFLAGFAVTSHWESNMEMNLKGQRVVVCGAARGIGAAIVIAFANEDCHALVLTWRDQTESTLDSAEWIAGDVSSRKDVDLLATKVPDIDHVVFAVGIGSDLSGSPFWNLDPSDWQREIDVNLLGAVNLAHSLAPAMAARQRGSFDRKRGQS